LESLDAAPWIATFDTRRAKCGLPHPGMASADTSANQKAAATSEATSNAATEHAEQSKVDDSEVSDGPEETPKKGRMQEYFGTTLGSMQDLTENIGGIGAKIKTGVGGALGQITEVGEGLGLSGIRKSSDRSLPMLHRQTDEASFKQFLVQVMKANVASEDATADIEEMSASLSRKTRRTTLSRALGKKMTKPMRCQLCPRTQMMCWQCCRWIVSKWFFHLLAFSFLILHCVALVLVADNATDQPDMWRSISLGYFAFFLVEFFVWLVGEHAWGFWRSSSFWFDLLLALLCVVEAFLPLALTIGPGRFSVLSLRLLRLVRRIYWLPRESKATMASFGLLPGVVFLLLCVVWAFLAVLWFLVLDTQPATAATETGPHAANNSEPLVVDVAEYDDFVSSLLNQFYLASRGMNWRRITDGISGGWNADLLRLSFVLLLSLIGLVTTNAMIVLVYELAHSACEDFEQKNHAETVRQRLFGLHTLEEKLLGGAGNEEDMVMLDRDAVEKILPEAHEELRAQGITAEEFLQLFDHLEESSSHHGVMISELLFGILLLTANAGEADNLQVDHLQKKCIQITDAANKDLAAMMQKGHNALREMEDTFLQLRQHLAKLRSNARRSSAEVKSIILEVEKQFEDCGRSVGHVSELRKVQLSQAMRRAREQLSERLEMSKMTASQLDNFNRLGRAFGFPALSERGPMPKVEAVRELMDPEEVLKAGTALSEGEQQFQLAAALLRAEVRDRFEKKLQQHFQGEADLDQGEVGVTTYL